MIAEKTYMFSMGSSVLSLSVLRSQALGSVRSPRYPTLRCWGSCCSSLEAAEAEAAEAAEAAGTELFFPSLLGISSMAGMVSNGFRMLDVVFN